jgi:hypothetical protein
VTSSRLGAAAVTSQLYVSPSDTTTPLMTWPLSLFYSQYDFLWCTCLGPM